MVTVSDSEVKQCVKDCGVDVSTPHQLEMLRRVLTAAYYVQQVSGGCYVTSPEQLAALYRRHREAMACTTFDYRGTDPEAIQACVDLYEALEQMDEDELQRLEGWLKKHYPHAVRG